jgi:hypothetical protein
VLTFSFREQVTMYKYYEYCCQAMAGFSFVGGGTDGFFALEAR